MVCDFNLATLEQATLTKVKGKQTLRGEGWVGGVGVGGLSHRAWTCSNTAAKRSREQLNHGTLTITVTINAQQTGGVAQADWSSHLMAVFA